MYLLQPQIWLLTGISVLFAAYDVYSRRVPLWLFSVSAAVGISVCILNEREITDLLPAMIPGTVCILLSLCTQGGIGTGDGHYFLVAALFLDWEKMVLLTAVSFLSAAAVSLMMILYGNCRGRSMKKKSLPFLAFMPFSILLTHLL